MVKVLVHYSNTKPFGIEVTKEDARDILDAYINKDEEVVEVEGYGIYPKEATKIEFF